VVALMTVGRPVNELYEACRDSYARAGLPFFMHHIGHSLGVEIHEVPMVEPGETTSLQENMLFNIELYHRDAEGQGYFVEDLIQVTTVGPRVLTGQLAPAEIPVIG
jgi:Xaa-Pro dipeptidase